MKKRVIGVIVILALLTSLMVTATAVDGAARQRAGAPLRQSAGSVPSSWAAAEVERAKELNLVPASLQSNYRAAITRAEFCLMI